jgi:hypothetical protein
MIETIKPDERGRVSILPYLNMLKWKYGQAVKVDFLEVVELPPSN